MELGRPLATITPTLDGDVPAVLARHDLAFTTGALHRVLTRHSEEGIRKVLQRLTRQGIVHAERVGNAYNYRLNRGHLAAERIVELADLMNIFLSRLTCTLEGWAHPPVYAAVFGSAARGTMSAESDLDLLLVRPEDAHDDDLWTAHVDSLAESITRWIGNDARVLQIAESELTARGSAEPVLHDVLREGLTVAGSRTWLAKQLRGPRA